MRSLSSSLTFAYKFLFVPSWSVLWGLGTLLMFSTTDPEVAVARWFFVLFWFIGTAGGLMLLPLKRVRLEGETLLISNYLSEIAVPAQTIADVRQNRWCDHRPITVTFTQDTQFGSQIVFMPRASFRVFTESDEVHVLRRIAGIRRRPD